MLEPKNSKRETLEVPALGMKLTDICYVVFRQKWIILGCLCAGLIAGLIVFIAQKPMYWSEAKLMVLYVTQTKSMETADGAKVRTAEIGGETAINSEMEILTSLDLCEEVAKIVGPEKVLEKNGGGSNSTVAAMVIYSGIQLDNPRRSNIIKVRFAHADPTLCQIVLRQLITSYLRRHDSIHHTEGAYETVLEAQATRLQGLITTHQEELAKLNQKAGVTSLDEDKKNYLEQLARLRQQVFETEAQLAEFRMMTGTPAAPAKNDAPSAPAVPAEKLNDYRVTSSRVENLRAKEFELTAIYTDDNPLVQNVRQQIAEQARKKKALEAEFPALTNLQMAASLPLPASPELRMDPRRVAALEAKLSAITNQVAQVREELTTLEKEESAISTVKRKLELDSQNYKRLMAEIESIRRSDAIANVKSNIQAVQNPSAPAPNVSQRLKLVAGTFLGCLAFGIALAFFIEIFVDHTIRRPSEFEAKAKLPLFLSIPRMGLNGHAKLLPFPVPGRKPPKEEPVPGAPPGDLSETWAADHPLRRYIDGVRDATLNHFAGDPHKPKLIGVTSCGEKAGVTSIAAGLAGALSETGEGNVLLLNLNYEAEAAHPFYRGELACALSDALELDKRANGKVLQNLYVATAGNPDDPATQSLPKQLARVVPKLRVCDYDYIVFDLPPTTPTTMTARLAGMMDLVILVVESGKDTQDSVKQAGKLLARSKAPVSAVLNKVHDPVPKWLQQGA